MRIALTYFESPSVVLSHLKQMRDNCLVNQSVSSKDLPSGPVPVANQILATGRDLASVAAALGAVMFLFLSLMYDRFYGALGIEPEDVGLTRAAILARSAAGVLAIAGTGVAIVVALGVINLACYGISRALKAIEERILRSEGRERIEKFRNSIVLGLFRTFANQLWMVGLLGAARPTRRVFAWFVFAGAAVALIATFGFGWSAVGDSANLAAQGKDVGPHYFAHLRVLDISSTRCSATWLSSDPVPAGLLDPDLHCLGQANGATLFRTADKTIRVPSSLVATEFG